MRATGGLADTVRDGITGFSFYDFSTAALWDTIQRATYTYNADGEGWRRIQLNGMSTDFSWQRSLKAIASYINGPWPRSVIAANVPDI